jgi:hypothetical protein
VVIADARRPCDSYLAWRASRNGKLVRHGMPGRPEVQYDDLALEGLEREGTSVAVLELQLGDRLNGEPGRRQRQKENGGSEPAKRLRRRSYPPGVERNLDD